MPEKMLEQIGSEQEGKATAADDDRAATLAGPPVGRGSEPVSSSG